MINEVDQLNDLDRSALFQDLTLPQLEEIVKFCTYETYNDYDILIHEDETEQFDLFLLVNGSVEIVSNNSSLTSSEVVLSKEDKDIYGEASWLTKHKRSATVRCKGPVEAIRIDGKALEHHLQEDYSAGYAIMKNIAILLAERMQHTDNLLKQLLWNSGV